MRILLVAISALLLLLSGCGKSHVGYSSSQDGPPSASSYPSNQPARLPSGKGGYVKTGKPYQIAGRWYYPLSSAAGYNETGTASWYGTKFHGKKTANGERYDMHAMSAAHKTLPMPTMARVTNLNNGRSVVVRVNDRGPFAKGRIIDLSYAAARALGYDNEGTAPVRVETLGQNSRVTTNSRPAVRPAPKPLTLPTPPPVMPEKGTTPPVAAIKHAVRHGEMYIQLGAFSSVANANRLKSQLQSGYPSVAIYSRNGGYSEIYRVRIGPFNDEKKIETDVLALQEQGYTNAIVVIE